MTLVRRPNLAQADKVYEMLLGLHEGHSTAESMRLDARLILTLCNHIGDADVIAEAIALAAGAGGAKRG